MIFQDLHTFAVGRTSKRKRRIVERTTSIAIETAFIVDIPKCRTTPDALWLSISFNVAGFCGMIQDQDECQQPAEVQESKQSSLMPSLW